MNLIRRFGLPLYWLVFAAYAAREGQYPRPLPYDDEIGYQWGAAFGVWITLAVAVLILHRIIDPKKYSTASPRFGKAFGFSLLLFPIFYVMFVARNLPPVLDVPMSFAAVTAVLTLVCAAIETIVIEVRNRKAND